MGDKIRVHCTQCKKSFVSKKNLERHLLKGHRLGQETVTVRNGNKHKCPLCGITNIVDFEQFKDHVLKSHEVRLQMYYYKFNSQSRFIAWKRKVEEQTKSCYLKETKFRAFPNNIPVLEETKPCITKRAGGINYRCHRSGYIRIQKEETERKRVVKAQGSVKINAFCPAMISTEFKSNGSVKVIYCSTHVGHECEVTHLRLTEDERREIVAKIAAKIPYDVILDEIRNTAGSSISRKHILTKKDLRTIARSAYFKKFDQSLKSVLFDAEPPTNEKSLENSLPNPQSDDIEEFDDSEIQTFDPNGPDSDSEMLMDYAEVVNGQSHSKFNVTSFSPVMKHKKVKKNNMSSLIHRKHVTSCNKPNGLTVSQKQSQLIEHFRTQVNKLTSIKELKWVENHINRMFILLKPTKEKTEIGKDYGIRHAGRASKTSDSVPNQNSSVNKIHRTPQIISKQFLPLSSSQSSKPPTDFQIGPVKSLPLKTGQERSSNNVTQQSAGNRKGSIKAVSDLKTQSSKLSGFQMKQYLVPIAGKPDKFLIVQTKPNDPPPIGPLTPVTSNQTQPNDGPNNNIVNIDHNYSSLK